MKYYIYAILICCLALSNCIANDTYVQGIIKNYENKEITLCYDYCNIAWIGGKKETIRTDQDGRFEIVIDDLKYLSSINWIKFKNKEILFCLQAGDSIFIEIDSKNQNIVNYKGQNSSRNIFIKDYYKYGLNRNKSFFYPKDHNTYIFIRKRYISDTLMLHKYKKKYSLDTFFVNFFMNELKYNYLNSLSTSDNNLEDYFKIDSSLFGLNCSYLKNHFYYYSALSGYISIVKNKNFSYSTIEGLQEVFRYSDKLLAPSFSEHYKAYSIRHYIDTHFKTDIRKDSAFKDLVKEYMGDCSDQHLKNDLEMLFRDKNIEL